MTLIRAIPLLIGFGSDIDCSTNTVSTFTNGPSLAQPAWNQAPNTFQPFPPGQIGEFTNQGLTQPSNAIGFGTPTGFQEIPTDEQVHEAAAIDTIVQTLSTSFQDSIDLNLTYMRNMLNNIENLTPPQQHQIIAYIHSSMSRHVDRIRAMIFQPRGYQSHHTYQ